MSITLEKAIDILFQIVYNKIRCKSNCVWLAQLDRASGYGPEGREFESSTARKPFRIKVLE